MSVFLSKIKRIFTRPVYADEKVYLPKVRQINSLQDLSGFLRDLNKQIPSDLQSVIESEQLILNVVKSPTLIEGHFDTMLHNFETTLKLYKGDPSMIKERFVCQVADMIYRLDAEHQIQLAQIEDKERETRRKFVLETSSVVADNAGRVVKFASSAIKDSILALIETARMAGKTAMLITDEFGHDIELTFDGGVTDIASKDISIVASADNAVHVDIKSDNYGQDKMTERSNQRQERIDKNRGRITYNANAYLNEWADKMGKIALDSKIFDQELITEWKQDNAAKRKAFSSGIKDHFVNNKSRAKIEADFTKTLFRLFGKLDRHLNSIGKSNYLSDVIIRYAEVMPKDEWKENLEYLSSEYSENLNIRKHKPQGYDTFIKNFLQSSANRSWLSVLVTVFSASSIVSVVVPLGFELWKSQRSK